MNAVPLPSFASSRAGSLITILAIGLGVIGCIGINEYLESLAIECSTPHKCHQVVHKPAFVGTFNGTLLEFNPVGDNAFANDPVETIISLTPDGTLKGTYRVHEISDAYTGQLVQQGPIHGKHVTFRWTDKFGNGTLEADFDNDTCQFEGKWRNDEGSMIDEPWNGHQ